MYKKCDWIILSCIVFPRHCDLFQICFLRTVNCNKSFIVKFDNFKAFYLILSSSCHVYSKTWWFDSTFLKKIRRLKKHKVLAALIHLSGLKFAFFQKMWFFFCRPRVSKVCDSGSPQILHLDGDLAGKQITEKTIMRGSGKKYKNRE